MQQSSLGQEPEDGNVEYKWKLVGKKPERLRNLTTQMNYRLIEGRGEAIYELGVEDNGHPLGLSDADLAESINTIERMAAQLKCNVVVLKIADGEEGKIAEVLVRRVNNFTETFTDVRICVVGNLGCGKSTLIGVLTNGELDDGHGLARIDMLSHRHEVENGRTSSFARQILGFNAKGEVINHKLKSDSVLGVEPGWSDIVEESTKVISFLDLGGHESYLQTTVYGLASQAPDYGLVCVAANTGVLPMTEEHLRLSAALKLPIFVVITKIDTATKETLQSTVDQVRNILNSLERQSVIVRTVGDIDSLIPASSSSSSSSTSPAPSSAAAASVSATAAPSNNTHSPASGESGSPNAERPFQTVSPIFLVSNVTGEGLDALRTYLYRVPRHRDWWSCTHLPAEMSISEFSNVSGIGIVVSGLLSMGRITAGEELLLGPFAPPLQTSRSRSRLRSLTSGVSSPNPKQHDSPPDAPASPEPSSPPELVSNGSGTVWQMFRPAIVQSIHVKRTPVNEASAGQIVSVAVRLVNGSLEGDDDDASDDDRSRRSRRRNSAVRLRLRKGMALVHPSLNPVAYSAFDAEVRVFERSLTAAPQSGQDLVASAAQNVGLRLNSTRESVVLIGGVRQTVTATLCPPTAHGFEQDYCEGSGVVTPRLDPVDHELLASFTQPLVPVSVGSPLLYPDQLHAGDRARVHFTFRNYPEYIRVGAPLIFTDLTVKGEGIITKVYPTANPVVVVTNAPPLPPNASSARRKSAPLVSSSPRSLARARSKSIQVGGAANGNESDDGHHVPSLPRSRDPSSPGDKKSKSTTTKSKKPQEQITSLFGGDDDNDDDDDDDDVNRASHSDDASSSDVDLFGATPSPARTRAEKGLKLTPAEEEIMRQFRLTEQQANSLSRVNFDLDPATVLVEPKGISHSRVRRDAHQQASSPAPAVTPSPTPSVSTSTASTSRSGGAVQQEARISAAVARREGSKNTRGGKSPPPNTDS